ncbi:MAG TPA: YceH family protein [Bryobacteraceae bacterium]|nr:YceH family protein [Bryobacteraceae bacterium]
MDLLLNNVEVRVLGALLEKDGTTPEYYPLSLNALCAACNQKSNREPVMSLDEDRVAAAIDSLRAKGLALDISGGEHRVHKYGHRMGEAFNFDRREQALMCVLMLRGPQTVGELRGRSERVYAFDGLADVEATLQRLAERTPPLVRKLARRSGEKEQRFAHLLGGDVEISAPAAPPLEERVTALETALSDLTRQFEEFRKKFD